jgi:APA family basic amino acid/polyamine antiporter
MTENTPTLAKRLGLLDASSLIIGSMIGSGIFLAPSLMANYIQTPGLLILMWVLGGIITICGALSYGELAGAMPKAGGQYVFLKDAYSPLWGFLYGWTLFLVIQTGFIAAIAIAFGKYLGVFFPVFSEKNILFAIGPVSISSVQLIAIASIALLTIVNIFGVKLGAIIQNFFTILKVAAIIALIVFVFLIGKGSFHHFTPVFSIDLGPAAINMGFLAAFAVAMSKAFFAYDSWNAVTFAAEEIKNPQRVLPLSLIVGTGAVTVIYTLAAMAYQYILPPEQLAHIADNRVAAAVAQIAFGPIGLNLVALAILISTFGCSNGVILTGPRVFYAMAKDNLFFEKAKTIHPVYKTPHVALLLQGCWAIVLTLSGTFNNLLTYTTFASLSFNVLTVFALFIFRKRHPDMPRPYRVWGYPIVPLLYILPALFFIVFIFIGDVRDAGAGLLIVLTGVPVYWYWKRKSGQK